MKITDSLKKKQLGVPICVALLGAIFFAVMVWWYQSNGVVGLDQRVIERMAAVRRDWLTGVVRAVTFFGSVTFIVTTDLLITGIGIWKKYNGRDLLLLNLDNISGVTLMQVLKMIFSRERPPLPWLGTAGGFSFPSGHSLMTTVFYGFLLFLVVRNRKAWAGRKWLIATLGCLPVLVGLSRVYLGVHYASDVLAGWAAGLAWAGVWMVVRELAVKDRHEA